MEKKYSTIVDVNTGIEVQREYTEEEYAQAAADELEVGHAAPSSIV